MHINEIFTSNHSLKNKAEVYMDIHMKSKEKLLEENTGEPFMTSY